ncbi:MAG: hypothetical protein ACOX0U_03460 [Oscillospiraceae bacterium]|jgi:regulatory protein YycI of two-component signal transduction system YycFG
MEWSKLKNIILLILVSVNVFLLVLVVYRQHQTVQLEAREREDVVEVLQKNGISMAVETLPSSVAFWNLQIEQDRLQTRRIAEAVLGNITEETRGSAVTYKNEKGTMDFQGNGTFSIVFHAEERIPSEQEKKSRQKTLLREMKLTTEDEWRREQTDGTVSYSARQQVDGITVFNCVITVTYSDDRLVSMEGTYLAGKIERDGAKQTTLSVFTALIRLIQYEAGHSVQSSEIQSIQMGYFFPTTLTSVAQMEPVWRISTDKGNYYVNRKTGAVAEEET